MTESLRLIFAGTPEFAVPALQALIASDHRVVAAYTQPDRPAGRGRKLTESPVKQLAGRHSIPIEQPRSLRDAKVQARLVAFRPDAVIVAAYGLMLPQPVLDYPRLGCINIHASLLPRWRGAAPIQRAILNGDRLTGITIMQMTAGLDTGPILLQRETGIGQRETAGELHDRLAQLGAAALVDALDRLTTGHLHPHPQDERLATYAKKLDKSEAEIDWHGEAITIERQVRAFNPWPIAQTHYLGKPLRIWEASVLEPRPAQPAGTVLAEAPAGIDVATGDGVLRILRLQAPGGKVLSARDFLNARTLAGTRLPS